MRFTRDVAVLSYSLVVVALFCAPAVAGDGGHLGLYTDPGMGDCNLTEVAAPMSVYLVHSSSAVVPNVTVEFRVEKNWPGVFDGAVEWGSNAFIGNPYTGIVVSYVGCRTLPHYVGSLQFFYGGTPSPPCTATLEVVGSPTSESGELEATLCNLDIVPMTGGLMTINGNGTCPCLVPTEKTSWSRIKALYR